MHKIIYISYLEAEGMEKTYKFTQEQIRENVDLSTQAKVILLYTSE